LDDAAHDLGTGGVREARELLEMVLEMEGVRRPAARCADQEGALDGITDFVEFGRDEVAPCARWAT
jgi:hypothetical protein